MNRKRDNTRVFQERTNSIHSPKSSQPPKQSVVFECTQGLNIQFKAPIVAVGPFPANDDMFVLPMADQNTKRTQRYHAAETALTQSFTKFQDEERNQEPRITALHKALSVLNAHAVDAQQGAEKLRTLLANHEVDPKEYQLLQQQRWREEKRRNAAEQVSQTLKKQFPSPQAQPQKPQPRSKPSEDNLVHFLTDSRHRIPLHLRHSAKSRSSGVDRSRPLEYPRRIAHNSLIPLSLKAPSTKRQFLQSIQHTRKNLPPSLRTSPLPTTPVQTMAPLPPVTVPTTSFSSLLEHVPQPTSPGGGTALIFQDHPHQPAYKPVGDLSITMPGYVADLLSEFDDNVGTNLPFNAPFTNQQTSTLHKSSSRSRMSAFIPGSIATRFASGENASPRKSKRASMAPPSSYVAPEPPMLPPIVIEPGLMSTSTPSVTLSQSAASQDLKDASRTTPSNKALARLRRKISALRQN